MFLVLLFLVSVALTVSVRVLRVRRLRTGDGSLVVALASNALWFLVPVMCSLGALILADWGLGELVADSSVSTESLKRWEQHLHAVIDFVAIARPSAWVSVTVVVALLGLGAVICVRRGQAAALRAFARYQRWLAASHVALAVLTSFTLLGTAAGHGVEFVGAQIDRNREGYAAVREQQVRTVADDLRDRIAEQLISIPEVKKIRAAVERTLAEEARVVGLYRALSHSHGVQSLRASRLGARMAAFQKAATEGAEATRMKPSARSSPPRAVERFLSQETLTKTRSLVRRYMREVAAKRPALLRLGAQHLTPHLVEMASSAGASRALQAVLAEQPFLQAFAGVFTGTAGDTISARAELMADKLLEESFKRGSQESEAIFAREAVAAVRAQGKVVVAEMRSPPLRLAEVSADTRQRLTAATRIDAELSGARATRSVELESQIAEKQRSLRPRLTKQIRIAASRQSPRPLHGWEGLSGFQKRPGRGQRLDVVKDYLNTSKRAEAILEKVAKRVAPQQELASLLEIETVLAWVEAGGKVPPELSLKTAAAKELASTLSKESLVIMTPVLENRSWGAASRAGTLQPKAPTEPWWRRLLRRSLRKLIPRR